MMNKSDLTKQLYLSCVENYFLAWLSKYYDVSNLYSVEFRSVVNILNDFTCDISYENYNMIKRLQDISEEYQITSHTLFTYNVDELYEYLEEVRSNDLILIRVNQKFINKYLRQSWRDDHYIVIDKNLRWINQFPLSLGTFTYDELKEYYDNQVLTYKLNYIKFKPMDHITSLIINQKFNLKGIPVKLNDLESAIGVIRITRKRLKEYYKDNTLAYAVLTEEVDLLDKLYLQIRRDILKGNFTKNFKDSIDSIIFFEKKLCEVLKWID